MLSILIPTYNTNITPLVNILTNQLRRQNINSEIIFCEDASTKYCEENQKLTENAIILRLVNDTNLGRTATRSRLAKKAKYEWLLFLDADVLVEKKDFISTYLQHIESPSSIFSGGTSYITSKPNAKELRWAYGTYREGKSASERQKHEHFVISQNLFIKKEVFLKLNMIQSRRYGLDNIFSYQIISNDLCVLHINNPILHEGLENNVIFLKKSLEAIESLVYFEREGIMGEGFTSLQQAYVKSRKLRITGLLNHMLTPFSNSIRKNLLSTNPSLFLFDLYRLHHYIKLKRNA